MPQRLFSQVIISQLYFIPLYYSQSHCLGRHNIFYDITVTNMNVIGMRVQWWPILSSYVYALLLSHSLVHDKYRRETAIIPVVKYHNHNTIVPITKLYFIPLYYLQTHHSVQHGTFYNITTANMNVIWYVNPVMGNLSSYVYAIILFPSLVYDKYRR